MRRRSESKVVGTRPRARAVRRLCGGSAGLEMMRRCDLHSTRRQHEVDDDQPRLHGERRAHCLAEGLRRVPQLLALLLVLESLLPLLVHLESSGPRGSVEVWLDA